MFNEMGTTFRTCLHRGDTLAMRMCFHKDDGLEANAVSTQEDIAKRYCQRVQPSL